jgi:hypothetical protein
MEDLFRFVLTRPPRERDKKSDKPISMNGDSPFQHGLATAAGASNPKTAAKAVALQYAQSQNFVAEVDDLRCGEAIENMSAELDELGDLSQAKSTDLTAIFKEARESLAHRDVSDEVLDAESQRLVDSILTIKLSPNLHALPIEHLINLLRHIRLLQKINDEALIATDGARIAELRMLPLQLPSSLLPPPPLDRPTKNPKPTDNAPDKQKDAEFKNLLDKYVATRAATQELTGLKSTSLQSTIRQASVAIQSGQVALAPERRGFFAKLFTKSEAGNARQAFDPKLNDQAGFRLTPAGAANLSRATQSVLQEIGVDVTSQMLDTSVAALSSSLRLQADELDRRHPLLSGSNSVTSSEALNYMTPSYGEWTFISTGTVPRAYVKAQINSALPTTHGTIEPVGVADLLIVKQQLKRYDAVDIAHIENVLKGESKKRIHRRTDTTEQTLLNETETTTTEEHDLESTERFEINKEADSVIKTDASLQAGVTISGKYGPVVDFSASAQGSVAVSKQEATKHAENYSRDVTVRSSKNVTERVLQRQTLKITNEIEEINKHSIVNTANGAANIAGIYQWVNKVYQAQIFNYGLRTLFDFMVPEPAAFVIAALKASYASATDLVEPTPFTLRIADITESNYGYWALKYEATGLKPPPDQFRTVTAIGKASGIASDNAAYTDAQQISIDEGYAAIYAYVGQTSMVWDVGQFVVDVVIGSAAHRFDSTTGWVWGTSLASERGSIAFAITTFKVSDIGVAVEVKCQRTDVALDKWRADTHATLLLAYQKLLSEYREKLEQLKQQAGVEISGRNPASNVELINGELKKICTSILSQQHYDSFGAIENGTNGLPQTQLAEAELEGPYVRFFEQAFEWDHMVFIFYPYFWGRKTEWVDKLNYQDVDPLFQQFLKAGYCRVVIPVRPNFEGAVDHFMHFGEPWFGGPLPPVTSPLYIEIADELAQQLGRPGSEVAEGDPWEVNVPTTLVALKDDGVLPSWHQNADGTWSAD